ncbi:MAG: hypothetical protein J4F28_09510, partial [Nitrosopumilaceae archaeon]|nr:hypothetical protein [Nitrosopumilaceae archaeon]
ESYAEMRRHPEHVKLNMTKWADLGFEECHVWSTHPGIADVREELTDEQKERVRTFVVKADNADGVDNVDNVVNVDGAGSVDGADGHGDVGGGSAAGEPTSVEDAARTAEAGSKPQDSGGSASGSTEGQ